MSKVWQWLYWIFGAGLAVAMAWSAYQDWRFMLAPGFVLVIQMMNGETFKLIGQTQDHMSARMHVQHAHLVAHGKSLMVHELRIDAHRLELDVLQQGGEQ